MAWAFRPALPVTCQAVSLGLFSHLDCGGIEAVGLVLVALRCPSDDPDSCKPLVELLKLFSVQSTGPLGKYKERHLLCVRPTCPELLSDLGVAEPSCAPADLPSPTCSPLLSGSQASSWTRVRNDRRREPTLKGLRKLRGVSGSLPH